MRIFLTRRRRTSRKRCKRSCSFLDKFSETASGMVFYNEAVNKYQGAETRGNQTIKTIILDHRELEGCEKRRKHKAAERSEEQDSVERPGDSGGQNQSKTPR